MLTKVVMQTLINGAEKQKPKTILALFTIIAASPMAVRFKMTPLECLARAKEIGCTSNMGPLDVPEQLPQAVRGVRGMQKLEVNKEELQKVINELESEQTFDTLGDLWTAVEQTEWAKNMQPRPLTHAIIMLRVKEFNLTYKTSGTRGKEKVEVDLDDLKKQIDLLESKRTFDKQSDLYEAVANTDWAKNHKPPITASVVYLRVREFNIECKTQSRRRKPVEPQDESDELLVSRTSTEAAFQLPANDPTSKFNFGVPIKGELILTPAGDCPHRLSGISEEQVLKWANDVVVTFWKTHKKQLLPSAIAYFARDYYGVFTPEYKQVKEIIGNNKHDLYDQI